MTRIFVVEENDVTRRVACETLRPWYDVDEFACGEPALEAARRAMPDLVVEATFVPDMPAPELRRLLRALPGAERLRVVGVAGLLDGCDLHGFDAVVLKPLVPATLLRTVQSQLDPGRRTSALGRGRRLLIVDDDAAQLRLAALGFGRAGFVVQTASDGIEALSKARLFRPEAVVCDVLMPRLDGFATCAALRLDPELASVPVLLASSNFAEKEDHRAAGEAGATALLQRTPDVAPMIAAVVAALDRASPPPPTDPEAFDSGRLGRLERQVERLADINGSLARRAELHRVMLDGITAVAGAVESGDRESDALFSLLDATGIAAGAIYLCSAQPDPGNGVARAAACGFDADELRRLDDSVNLPRVRNDVLSGGEALLADPLPRPVLAVPIAGRGETLGILVLACFGDAEDPEILAFARRTGVAIGGALLVNRLLDELATSEHRYRALVDNAYDAICVLATDGTILEANRSAEALLRAPRDRIVGQSYVTFLPPHSAAESLKEFGDAATGSGVLTVTSVPQRRGDGTLGYADWNVRRIELGSDTVMLAVGRDATDRRRAEHELRVLHEVTLAASVADDLSAALQIVLDRICVVTGWDCGSAWLPDDKAGEVRLRASWAVPEKAPTWQRVLPRSFARGIGLVGKALADGKLSWSRDAQADPRSAHRSGLVEAGLHAVFTIPVVLRGEVLAVLQCSSALVREEDPRVVELASAIAAQVASVIGRKRAEEALRESESRLRQSQKMEALGRLTGGIAHDFNNLLTVIGTNAQLLIEQLPEGDPRRVDAKEIRLATDRAAALTRQLLAFSRRQLLEPRVIAPGAVVTGMEKMLRRLIGEHIRFSAIPDADAGCVYADPGQIEQVIMNLVVNACDAMPTGGELRIRTRNVEVLDPSPGLVPGRFIVISVSDTGCGIDETTRSHLFEPFFTTKEKGRGTGLGLSTCYGIVRQSDGAITVESEPGVGSTFRIYLPRVEQQAETARGPAAPAAGGGSETILVVEDDAGVREILKRTLGARGYSVMLARDGAEALATCATTRERIDLILTDVVMPTLSGPEMSERLRSLGIETPVLFMSGYVDPDVPGSAFLKPGHAFIQKPFAPESLARKVREMLNKEAA